MRHSITFKSDEDYQKFEANKHKLGFDGQSISLIPSVDGNGDEYLEATFISPSVVDGKLELKIELLPYVLNANMNTDVGIHRALAAFLDSPQFFDGCRKATRAGWGGSGYSVELFPNEDWRVLWDNEIGNLYQSEGTILSLPKLDDSDYQECVNEGDMSEEEYFKNVFANDEEKLKAEMQEKLEVPA